MGRVRVLIDTQVFLWGLQDEPRLSQRARLLLPEAEVWISVVSLWEIVVKRQIGKLDLPVPTFAYLTEKLKQNGVSISPLSFDHVRRLEELPLHHRDPFDRILIAQSIEEDLPIMTADPIFSKYPVEIIW